MITGRILPSGEPIVSLHVKGADGRFREYDAIVDTGFNGSVALAAEALSELGLQRTGTVHVQYADDTIDERPVYRSVIEWDGEERTVEINSIASDVLIGVRLLAGFELRVAFIASGRVEISRLV